MIVYEGYLTVTKDRGQEVVHTTDSVAFLIVDIVHRLVLLINQQRLAMVRRRNPLGYITEVPAGRRDLSISVNKLVVKEAREETGKRIRLGQVKLLNRGAPLALSPGVLTERTYLAYVETDLWDCLADSSQTYGLASEGEKITRRAVTFNELERMKFEDMKTFALVQWFLRSQLLKEGNKT